MTVLLWLLNMIKEACNRVTYQFHTTQMMWLHNILEPKRAQQNSMQALQIMTSKLPIKKNKVLWQLMEQSFHRQTYSGIAFQTGKWIDR